MCYLEEVFTRLRNTWSLYRFALKDARTPTSAKILPLLSLVYLIWPIDILPDLIPLIGQVDDVGMIVLLFTLALRMIPKEVKREAAAQSADAGRSRVIDIEPRK